ncbi:acyl carrier protein [Kitasatospora sp. NPDC053057]|uniref:acyl carrier protein n=1 Tax=Kitasatospora sp. NPDC053057 TaxID=3364062 RepID=UPI0037C89611
MTFDQVKEILTDRCGLPSAPVTPDAPLASAGVDSMALVVLSIHLEDRFGVEISEDQLSAATCVDDMAKLISRYAVSR